MKHDCSCCKFTECGVFSCATAWAGRSAVTRVFATNQLNTYHEICALLGNRAAFRGNYLPSSVTNCQYTLGFFPRRQQISHPSRQKPEFTHYHDVRNTIERLNNQTRFYTQYLHTHFSYAYYSAYLPQLNVKLLFPLTV
jgi:hypothetical protein